MPSLLDIRRRIRAVKSTQQITKAMKMVAASKLRRAQDRIQQARPFATQMLRVLNSLAGRVNPSAHPLLDERTTPRAGGRSLLFIITADRGLCGSFNANVIKSAGNFIVEHTDRPVGLGLIGRRGRDYFAKRGFAVQYERVNLFAKLSLEDARDDRPHRHGRLHERRRRQRAPGLQRVPLGPGAARGRRAAAADPAHRLRGRRRRQAAGSGEATEYLYEPAPEQLFTTLLPTHVEVQVYRALLESNAAFYAAQMTAMDAATRNSGEMIENLTLYMNKVRQAAITREIIEVVSGAEAL